MNSPPAKVADGDVGVTLWFETSYQTGDAGTICSLLLGAKSCYSYIDVAANGPQRTDVTEAAREIYKVRCGLTLRAKGVYGDQPVERLRQLGEHRVWRYRLKSLVDQGIQRGRQQ